MLGSCNFVLYLDCPADTMEQRLVDAAVDKPAAIKRKLNTFTKHTVPVLQHYQSQGKTFKVRNTVLQLQRFDVFAFRR